jgi:hypothetical protein
MTVTTDTASITHSTDGSTTEFPVSFYFLNESDLLVDLISSAGALTHLVLGSNYTVGGAGNQDGGSVTTVATYAAGSTLRIYRNVAATQLTEYQQNDAFPAKTTEKALDKLTMLIQQAIAATLNSLRFPLAEYGTDGTLPSKGQRAGQILGFNDQGNVTMIPLPASVGAGDLRTDVFVAGVDFTGGETTQLTLSRSPGSVDNLRLHFDGAYQGPENIATLVGNVVTLKQPIPAYINRVYAETGTTLSVFVDADDAVKDALSYLNASTQSIPNNVPTVVTGWATQFDRLGTNFNAAAGVFTCPRGGFYQVSVSLVFGAAMPENTVTALNLIVNNSAIFLQGSEVSQSSSAAAHRVMATGVVRLATGDSLRVQAYQNSGGAISLTSNPLLNVFAVARV